MTADPITTERFAVLHGAADALLDELAERFMVERREAKELLGPEEALVRTVRLIPRTPAAGPLAVAFTDLPGLLVRLGRWWIEAVPASLLDDPAELTRNLRRRVFALVEGGLWERVRRSRLGGSRFEARLIADDIDEARGGPLAVADARDARQNGFAAAIQWAPWPIRPPRG